MSSDKRRGTKKKIKQNDDSDSSDIQPTCSSEALPKRWPCEEKKAVYSSLHDFIKNGMVPNKEACMKAIAESGGVLSQRSWRHVKFAVKIF